MFNDLMENIEWFFNLHDKNKDGLLTKDEVLTLSESFLVRSCLKTYEDEADGSYNSSYFGTRSAMRIWAPSAASCPMHSNMAMRCFPLMMHRPIHNRQ
jgi:hypothetical protein